MRTGLRIAVVVFAVIAVLPVLEGVVSAHHGRAGYGGEAVKINGTVVELRWRNPHVYVVYDVKDDAGNVVQWTGEVSSTTTMIAAGWSRFILQAGDEIEIVGRQAENGSPHQIISELVKADGTVLVRDTGQTRERQ